MLGLGLKSWLREHETAFWDKRLGVSTLGCNEGAFPEGALYDDPVQYQSLSYYLNWQFCRRVRMNSGDVFFDIGCGAGRMLCIAALGRVGRCVGIELSSSLCALARKNAASLRFRHAPIEVNQVDAALADYASGTVFFLFNPFGVQTIEAVVARIHQSIIEHPRRVRVIFVHPPDVQRRAFDAAHWLRFVAEKPFICVAAGGLARPSFGSPRWLRLAAERSFIGGPSVTASYYEHTVPTK